jgi:hypothetical protein
MCSASGQLERVAQQPGAQQPAAPTPATYTVRINTATQAPFRRRVCMRAAGIFVLACSCMCTVQLQCHMLELVYKVCMELRVAVMHGA